MSTGNFALEAQERIQSCQRVLRLMTGIILGAFALIILMTTLSTGSFVQASGRLLYYLIVLAALCSLADWIYRDRLEKQVAKAYIGPAMDKAHYGPLPEGGLYFGEIPDLQDQGVRVVADTREACRTELRKVLERWLIESLRKGHTIPPITASASKKKD